MKYNGWKNYQTWNVWLWIANDEGLYRMARSFIRRYTGRTPYRDFATMLIGSTLDGVKWTDSRLSYGELNRAIRELRGD